MQHLRFDQRVQLIPRKASLMDLATALSPVEIAYRGFVISHPTVQMTSAWFDVNLGSNQRHLMNLLDGQVEVFQAHESLEAAIEKAKRRVDNVLGRR
jgi:hypothetical protein